MSNPTPLILASTSPYRRLLLSRLGVPFEVESPLLDEEARQNEMPAAVALRLAEAKALVVAARRPGSFVIGSDQVAHLSGNLLDKPVDRSAALAQLMEMSGRDVEFLTAICLFDGRDGTVRRHLDATTVSFRRLTFAESERYVAKEPSYDCAGGFKVEGLGIGLFDRIVSEDPSALVGLPLIATARFLRETGLYIP